MELKISIDGDLAAIMKDEKQKMALSCTMAVHGAGMSLKRLIRAQVQAAGLGPRVSNTIQAKFYPESGISYEPAAFVYSKAPKIVAAFNDGSLIRSTRGLWLAIPADIVGRAKGGRKLTPHEWESRTGRKLVFVLSRHRHSAVLIAEDVRFNTKGHVVAKGGRRRKDGILTGSQSAVIFHLVPQVSLRKRLDLDAAVQQAAASIPLRVITSWG